MTIEGLPASWRAAFLTNPATAATTLVVDSPVEAVAGEYALRIVGRSGSLTSETVVIVRLKPPEIRLELVTPGAVVSPGGAARFVINARSVDDSARPVNLRVEGLPNGATATILPNPATGNSNVDISVSAAAIPGNYGFQVVASLDGVEVRLNAVLLVAVQYTTNFQFSPTPVTAVPGQNRGYGLASPSSTVAAPAGGFVSFDQYVSDHSSWLVDKLAYDFTKRGAGDRRSTSVCAQGGFSFGTSHDEWFSCRNAEHYGERDVKAAFETLRAHSIVQLQDH
jgi:hypothetical protein